MLSAAATHTAKAGTSIIGTALHPIFVLVGYVLAFFYGLVPDYAVAIALLTIAVMIVVFPLTRASARSMMRMQLLSPEMKKIQTRYKAKPGMPTAERQELRQKMNEEVMALYRENGVNPTGGCLPMFLQFPILIVLYDVVRGLAKTADVLNAKGQKIYVHGKLLVKATPQNIPKTSRMYRDLVAAHGQMHVLGINLADSVRTHQPHLVDVLPYALLVLIAVGLQYVSIWQVTNRNPAASAANQQMQQMQKYMPLIFLVLYIALPQVSASTSSSRACSVSGSKSGCTSMTRRSLAPFRSSPNASTRKRSVRAWMPATPVVIVRRVPGPGMPQAARASSRECAKQARVRLGLQPGGHKGPRERAGPGEARRTARSLR